MTQLIEPEPRERRLSSASTIVSAVESGERMAALMPDAAAGDSAPSLVEPGVLARLAKGFAVQDGLLCVYFALMLGAVTFGTGPGHEQEVRTVLMDIALFSTGLVITRGGVLKIGTLANEYLYRFTIFCSVFLTYFQLRHILPAVSSRAVDGDILAFDLRVFGVEPSLAWDKYVNPQTTEWFAFFYFGYFFILIAHVVPMMLNAHNRFRIAHFTLGICTVFCTGHLVYMLVPGWGPYRQLAPQFHHALDGGLFWHLVKATVDAGGAQKDIFPSLHTAAPTYFAIYSYLHRRSFPFRYSWPFIAFAATQIIVATMFLRWHYLVDIVAGLTLATTAALGSYKIVQWETRRRARRGAPPIFAILEWPWQKRDADGDAS